MSGRAFLASTLSSISCFAMAIAAPIRLDKGSNMQELNLVDNQVAAGISWTPHITAIATGTAIAFLCLLIVDSVVPLLHPPLCQLNRSVSHLLRHKFLYLSVLLVLSGFCIDIAKTEELVDYSESSSAFTMTAIANASISNSSASVFPNANPFPWDWTPSDRSVIEWLKSKESDILFSLPAVVIILGTLDMLQSYLHGERAVDGARTVAAAWSVGISIFVHFFHAAANSIAAEPGRPALYVENQYWPSAWVGIMAATGISALALGVLATAGFLAYLLFEEGLPQLLPGNFRLRSMSFLVLGSMFVDVANAAGTTSHYESPASLTFPYQNGGAVFSTSQARASDARTLSVTSLHLEAPTLATGLLELLAMEGQPLSDMSVSGRDDLSSGAERGRFGPEDCLVFLGLVVTLVMLGTTARLYRRFEHRETILVKFVSIACLLSAITALATNVSVTAVMLEEFYRPVKELGGTHWFSLAVALIAGELVACFALMFYRMAENGLLELGERFLEVHLPPAVHLHYLNDFMILVSVFMDVAGAASIEDAREIEWATTTEVLAVADLPTLVPQPLTPLPPYATCGNTLGPCSAASRTATPTAEFGIMPGIWAAGAIIFLIWIMLPRVLGTPSPQLGLKIAFGLVLASGFLNSVADASETTPSMLTSTSGSDIMPGIWIACAVLLTIWILVPSARKRRHAGLALKTAVSVLVASGILYTVANAVETAFPKTAVVSASRVPSATGIVTITCTSAGSRITTSFWPVVVVLLILATSVASAIHGIVPGSTRTSTITVPGPTRTTTLTMASIHPRERAREYEAQQLESWQRAYYGPGTLLTSASPSPDQEAHSAQSTEPDLPRAPIANTNPGATRLAIFLALLILSAILLPVAFASPTESDVARMKTVYQGRIRVIDGVADVYRLVPVAGGATLTVEDFAGRTSTWAAGERVKQRKTSSA